MSTYQLPQPLVSCPGIPLVPFWIFSVIDGSLFGFAASAPVFVSPVFPISHSHDLFLFVVNTFRVLVILNLIITRS